MTPRDIDIMVRTPAILSEVPREEEDRFGLHDDFLVGIDHKWGMISFEHPQYGMLLDKCNYVLTDGEMPWGRDTTVADIDHILFLKQCVGYSLTTLSVKHNYIEERESKGRTFHLEKWKRVYLTEEDLATNHFPYNPNMLEEGKISVYDYLKYHLGYQRGLSDFAIKDGNAEFVINNFGMAAPREFIMSVKVNGEDVLTCACKDMGLYKFGQYKMTIPGVNDKDTLSVSFRHRRSGESIKLANNLPYENGENIIAR